MSLTIGSRLGPYEVTAQIGAGGMGEVYRATDTNLKRAVAIKVLPASVATDPDRLTRFRREAEVLAAFNHPNIAQIHGIERSGDAIALVMELVEGPTLADLLAGQPDAGGTPRHLSLDVALPIARQIAEALEAAHEQGIIHRDLKPANIKVRDDGTVKVLDFGLAKALDPAAGSTSGSLANSPTMSMPAMTQGGVILGTAAYMSPEQARGRAVDRRADIWAFGVVLFEMLTGQQAFAGDTVSDTLAAVLMREPDWSALPPSTPPRVTTLLRRCLERDPKKRQRDIGDVRLELDSAIVGDQASMSVAPSSSARARSATRRIATAAALVVLGAVVGVALWTAVAPARPPAADPMRLSIAIPPALRVSNFNIAPDGKTVVVLAEPRRQAANGTSERDPIRLYTRRIDDYAFTALPGTERAVGWAISPDSSSVAFVATISQGSIERRIAKVALDGKSPPVLLADVEPGLGLFAWAEPDTLLLQRQQGPAASALIRLPAGGGTPSAPVPIEADGLTDGLGNAHPLPGGRGVLFANDIWTERGYQIDQWVLDTRTFRAKRLITDADNAAYVPPGVLVFTRADTLMMAPFNLDTLDIGPISSISGGVRTTNSWAHGNFSLSADGTLLFVAGQRVGSDRQLVVVDDSGRARPFSDDRRAFELRPAVSPDGRRVAQVVVSARGTYETWVSDVDRPAFRRALAQPNADNGNPLWSPDGRQLAYTRIANDDDDGIYVRVAEGGEPRLLLRRERPGGANPLSWVPDGSGILALRSRPQGSADLLFVPVATGTEPPAPRVLRKDMTGQAGFTISPDGRLIAYSSNESGPSDVYVAVLAPDLSFGPARRISTTGGNSPKWAGDSRRLFYAQPPETVMVTTIDARAGLSASTPATAYDLAALRVDAWTVLPDGRLLGVQRGEGEDDFTSLNVVLNWTEDVRGRFGR